MVAHEKRNSAQLFCAVPTQNDLALSSLLFSAHPTQKLGYPMKPKKDFCENSAFFDPTFQPHRYFAIGEPRLCDHSPDPR